MSTPEVTTVVLDLDGTLVDSVYTHVLAWHAAFQDVGVEVPARRIHRLVGMGGDRLVAAAAGQATEQALGDEVRQRHPQHLDRLFGSITPTEGALDLLEAMRTRGLDVVLASSGDRDLTERLLDVLPGSRDLLGRVVTGSDAEQSKPSGELVEVALGTADRSRAVLVGDAVWDVQSAADAGIPCLAVLTGGLAEAELRDAGAHDVVADAATLARRLVETGSLLRS
ncbi:HAD family hydrolase [Nocardioides dongxiaopingii]|uniref:HAD family hydrolase n=1 Tax=Nocardioides dongxiaopingii TaxID=2576036 RepID=UPI0010C76A00|nr:HAD family hydrolase [Nocardioides dongxiaopingii]